MHGARVRGSERASEGEEKIRGRNAGPLAPSSPWLQSLRGRERGSWPQDCSVDHDHATSRRLVPSTPARVPRPRRLHSSLCLSLCACVCVWRLSPVPQMPAAIFVLLSPSPLSGLLSHCDGTRGGKRGKAAARKVSLPVLGGVADQRRLGESEPFDDEHRHSPISATRFQPLRRCLCPSTPCVRAVECYF